MAKDLKISQMPSTILEGAEKIPVVKNNTNKTITTKQILDKTIGSKPSSGLLTEVNPSEVYTKQQVDEKLETKSDKIYSETLNGGIIIKEILPNKFYNFGECNDLTITLAPEYPGIYNEYMFAFKSNNTILNLPSEVKWMDNDEPIFIDGSLYQISIVNNIAVAGGTML